MHFQYLVVVGTVTQKLGHGAMCDHRMSGAIEYFYFTSKNFCHENSNKW